MNQNMIFWSTAVNFNALNTHQQLFPEPFIFSWYAIRNTVAANVDLKFKQHKM
jgi:hypothetical protein